MIVGPCDHSTPALDITARVTVLLAIDVDQLAHPVEMPDARTASLDPVRRVISPSFGMRRGVGREVDQRSADSGTKPECRRRAPMTHPESGIMIWAEVLTASSEGQWTS